MAESEENTDIISGLPDGVLSHILSFLPTRTCVTTSVLSRRWRHLWEYLQVLDLFDDSHVWHDLQPTMFKYFAVFVNGALTLRKSREVRKMRLACAYYLADPLCAYSVDTWIHSVIGPHLEELHLTLFSTDGNAFLIPLTLFTCSNLISLSLNGGVYVQVQHSSAVRLPLLKTLQLDIGFVEVDSVDAVLSGCPVLETLELSFATESLGKVRVPHSLKRLKVIVENYVGACLEVDAPGLNYLSLAQITFSDIGSLQNVVEASLDVFPPPQSDSVAAPLYELLHNLSGTTKRLVLGLSTTKWLLGGFPDLYFPEFRHLLNLELDLSCFNWTFMVDVLKKCNMLQSLIIQNDKEPPSPSWKRPLPKWGLPELTDVSNCVVSHLTFVHFKGFEGLKDDIAFAKYILQKGLVLKTMIITDYSLDLEPRRKFCILQSLSDVPRASCTCRLQFD